MKNKKEMKRYCSTMTECISRGRGCPLYTKLIVCTLMAILVYVVAEFVGEQMVKHKFASWGDILIVTPDPDKMPQHEYETKLWVKLVNLFVAVIAFALFWTHLTVADWM